MTLATLEHRRVSEADRETLLSMRKSCGWGMDRIDSYLFEPTWATYLFYRSSKDGQREHPVGMGCLVFELSEDPDMANRETDTIAIGEYVVKRDRTDAHPLLVTQPASLSTRNHEHPGSVTRCSLFSNALPSTSMAHGC